MYTEMNSSKCLERKASYQGIVLQLQQVESSPVPEASREK